jgi:hypothetical protein
MVFEHSRCSRSSRTPRCLASDPIVSESAAPQSTDIGRHSEEGSFGRVGPMTVWSEGGGSSPLRSGQPATGGTRYSMEGGSLRAGGTSRMTRECQVRICERLGVKFPGPTRPKLPKPMRQACPQPAKADICPKNSIHAYVDITNC